MSAETAKNVAKDILTYDEKLYASSVDYYENPLDIENSEQNPSDQREDNDSKALEDNNIVIIKGKENKDVVGEDAESEEKIDTSYFDEEIERIKKRRSNEEEEEEEEKEEEEEEVYEVEAIIDHRKSGDKMKYLIKWKGYPKDQATWELDKNVFAEDLIKDYLTKLEMTTKSLKSSKDLKSPVKPKTTATGSKDTAPTTSNKGRKRASTSSPSVNQESKNKHTPKKARIEENKNEPGDDTSDDWDDEVISVETVSRDEKSGELSVYLKWNDGNTSRHPAKEANIRCPQKMIKFYEQRLTFSSITNH